MTVISSNTCNSFIYFCKQEHSLKYVSQKKPFDKLDRGKYERGKLADAVRDVLNNVRTSEQAHREYGIPQRTVQHHVKYVNVSK